MAVNSNFFLPQATECDPAQFRMTRAELLALRTAGSLSTCSHYIMTDYSRANVGAAEILLHVVDATTFSQGVHVKTVHDDTAWDGIYDIDTNRITALRDNLGNDISGRLGNEVDRWDWGNARYTENTVKDADVFTTVGSTTLTLNANTFTSDTYVDLREASGALILSSMSSGARVNVNGATNLNLRRIEMASFGSLTANGQNDVRIWYATIANYGRFTRTGGTRTYLYYPEIKSYGHLQQDDGDVRVYYTTIADNSHVRQLEANIFQMYQSNISGRSRIFLYQADAAGATYMYGMNLTNASYIYHAPNSSGAAYYSYNSLDYGFIYNYGQGTKRIAYNRLSAFGRIYLYNDVSNTFCYYNSIDSGYIRVDASPNMRAYYNSVSGNAFIFIRNNPTNTKYAYQNDISSGGRMYIQNTINVRAYYNEVRSQAYMYLQTSYPRVYRSSAMTGSQQYYTNATHYGNTTMSQFRLFANANQTRYNTGSGQFTQALTAANTNRGRFQTLPFI